MLSSLVQRFGLEQWFPSSQNLFVGDWIKHREKSCFTPITLHNRKCLPSSAQAACMWVLRQKNDAAPFRSSFALLRSENSFATKGCWHFFAPKRDALLFFAHKGGVRWPNKWPA